MHVKMVFVGVFFVILLVFSSGSTTVVNRRDCRNKDGKCTANDPRMKLYPLCMYEKERSTLWCNYSNYTRIPDPDAVEKEIYLSCRSATTLDISDSCLTQLHKSDLAKYANMMTLKCRENLISRIQAGMFETNKKLETLDFCGNAIKTIETDSFNGLKNLQTLILDNNDLEELREGMFRGLSSLKKLSIHNNDIAVLRSRAFSQLGSLEILVITGNRIAYIDEEAFSGLESLTTLQLDGNKLRELGRDTLTTLSRLQVLSLSYNDFVTWPDFGENALINLQTLNLGHNMLEEIKGSNIANLSKLQNLSLENNSLHNLPEDLHLHTPNLRYLNISKNHFEAIREFAFTKLTYLETLDLRDNSLTTPYAEWFSRVTENGFAIPNVIRGNEWKCDCGVIHFHEFLTKQDAEWQDALRIVCHSPKNIVLQVSKVLNARVVEAIQANHDCGDTEPYVKSEGKINSTYPFTKIDPISYHPKTKKHTMAEATTTAVQSATRGDVTQGFMEQQNLPSPKMEIAKTDHAAMILIGAALLLFLVITAFSVICVIKRKQDKSDILEYKRGFSEDSRTDMEAGEEQKHLPVTTPTIQVNSQRPSSLMTQSETLRSLSQDEYTPISSASESTADPTYMTIQTVALETTIPKEIGSGNRSHQLDLPLWPTGIRQQPDGASSIANDV